jgi:hypothetical protein
MFMAFIDSTEQQIPRPIDKNRRKMYYSWGKKKRHTIVRNQIMVNNRGYIPHKARKKKGRKHDYDIYKKSHPCTPKQVVNVLDLGYFRVEKDFPEQLSALPCKKRRNQCLSQEEKEYNKIHSKKRIVVENTICRLKKYRLWMIFSETNWENTIEYQLLWQDW